MLVIKQLTKSFSGLTTPVLNQIDLTVPTGQFCILLGSNGCGKSTLMKTILGEHTADNGTIHLHQHELTQQSISARAKLMSCVNQQVHLGTIPELTLLENIALSQSNLSILKPYRRHRQQIQAAVKPLNLDLEKFIDMPLSTMSGGQRQMVATIMALQSQPSLLLLDEHTSALDPRAHELLMGYTAERIRQSGITTIMITHQLSDALQYGDRVIVMHGGIITDDFHGIRKQRLTLQQLQHCYQEKSATDIPGAMVC